MKKICTCLCVFLLIFSFSITPTLAAGPFDPSSIKKDIYSVSKQQSSKVLRDSIPHELKDKMKGLKKVEDMKLMGDIYEQEPNDAPHQADAINLDDIVFGTFWWEEDLDFYSLNMDETQDTYIYGTTLTTLNDLGYLLFSPDGEAIYPDELLQEGSEKLLIYYSLPPGSYYLVATDLNMFGGDGMYGLTAFTGEETTDNVYRIYGNDRYETAIEISKAGWPDGSDTVILARDTTFPDALAGAPFAYQEDAPILLNPKNSLNNKVKERIKELGAKKVVILGGEGAISGEVAKDLKKNGLYVERIGGKTRYETAANIAKQLGDYNQAVIAYGGNFPDALSIAPYAASNGIPILLSPKQELASETKEALKSVTDTMIVGGKGVISEQVEKQLAKKNPIRISGKDRYETSVNIATQLQIPGDIITVATGENFADALTGSVLAAKYYEPIILVQKNKVPDPVKAYISENRTWYYTVLGGEGPISEQVVQELSGL
ncbi:cell wall-binding repeat-containing protein [Rossellomorea vietnamensis]|uniref:cell wall-binding repeat-containing protein n=1 Tax=Rossellomorea vietnamensis TaxID=218284 RepID=UPI001CC91A4D|nr:cell wall-binding repeat-containing protein [Rossellomorea vietnamensis]MCA0150483.1 cell wall-binding repeat-containing protein [Rossellomorea vietnamensis]